MIPPEACWWDEQRDVSEQDADEKSRYSSNYKWPLNFIRKNARIARENATLEKRVKIHAVKVHYLQNAESHYQFPGL